MASRTADQAAAAEQPDRPLERDTPGRGIAGDLRQRLDDLSSAHPSAAEYRSGRASDAASPPGGPPPDDPWVSDVRLTPDRRTHVLDGDQTGGGHRSGTGRPGKTEFPADWTDDQIEDAILTVSRSPDRPPERQSGNDGWHASGKRNAVQIEVIVKSDGRIWTAWPDEHSPGVVRNPTEKERVQT